MENHFIVCGLGQVGCRVVAILQRLRETVVVVTLATREEWLEAARQNGGTIIQGDARGSKYLLAAGLPTARGLLVVTDDDLANIEIALDAKQLRPELPVVLRLFDRMLATQFQSGFALRQVLGVSELAAPAFVAAARGDRIINSFMLGGVRLVVGRVAISEAPQLANLSPAEMRDRFGLVALAIERGGGPPIPAPGPAEAIGPRDVVTVLTRAEDWEKISPPCGPSRRAIPPSGEVQEPRSNESSAWLAARKSSWGRIPFPLRVATGVLLALIGLSVPVFHWALKVSFIDALYFVITTVTTVGYGDITPAQAAPWVKLYACLVMLLGSTSLAVLFSIIADAIIRARFLQLTGRRRVQEASHFIVVGLSGLGLRIVEMLQGTGASVVVIDRHAEGEFTEAVRARAPVILGDARQPDILAKARADRAQAVIAVTDNDAVNLSVALGAKQANPGVRTVVRFMDTEFAHKVQDSLAVDAALTAAEIAAPAFAAAALHAGVKTAFLLQDQLMILIQREAGEAWRGQTLPQLRTESGVLAMRMPSPSAVGVSNTASEAPLRQDEMVLVLISHG